MATALQFKRYTTATLSSMAGLQGELIVDLDKGILTVHDGVTLGGTALATEGAVSLKQDILVSGTDIKTINGVAILGSGNITIGLNDLTDGVITAPANGEFLTFDGTNWVNTVHTVSANNIADMNTTGALPGQVLKYNGTVWVPQDDIDTTLTLSNQSVSDLGDVDTTTLAPTFGQVLKWDNANWVPQDDVDTHLLLSTSSIGALSDVNIVNTVPVEGYVLKYIGSEWIPQPDTDTTLLLSTESITGMQDVDTTTIVPNLTDLLSWDGSNWVPTSVPDTLTSINNIGDVDTATNAPITGEILQFDGLNWVPGIGTKSISVLTDVDVSTPPVLGDKLIFDGTNWVPTAPTFGGVVDSFSTPDYRIQITAGGAVTTTIDEVTFFSDYSFTSLIDGTGATVSSIPASTTPATIGGLLTTIADVSFNAGLNDIYFAFPAGIEPLSYEISASANAVGDEPTDFTLERSLDGGTTWSIIDTQAGLTWTAAETKQFTLGLSAYPFNPIIGQLFFNESINSTMRWNGTNWVHIETRPVNQQTGTAYTIQYSDFNKVISLNNAAAITLSVPSGLGDGFKCDIVQSGVGAITITGSGATVNNLNTLSTTSGQFATVSLSNIALDTFIINGDLV